MWGVGSVVGWMGVGGRLYVCKHMYICIVSRGRSMSIDLPLHPSSHDVYRQVLPPVHGGRLPQRDAAQLGAGDPAGQPRQRRPPGRFVVKNGMGWAVGGEGRGEEQEGRQAGGSPHSFFLWPTTHKKTSSSRRWASTTFDHIKTTKPQNTMSSSRRWASTTCWASTSWTRPPWPRSSPPCRSVGLSCLCVCLPVCLSVCLTVCLSVCLSVMSVL